MNNLRDKNSNNKSIAKEFESGKDEISEDIRADDILSNQGSEEQKMKEKYLSEISKIEDAPGDGGTERKEN